MARPPFSVADISQLCLCGSGRADETASTAARARVQNHMNVDDCSAGDNNAVSLSDAFCEFVTARDDRMIDLSTGTGVIPLLVWARRRRGGSSA